MLQNRKNVKEVTGFIQIPFHQSEDDSEEEEEEDDDFWLDYRESSDSTVQNKKPKQQTVHIEDAEGKTHSCTGRFPLTQVYWKVKVKIHRNWLRSHPAYSIRDDRRVLTHGHVQMFLSDCLEKLDKSAQQSVKACFESFCQKEIGGSVDFAGLEQTLKQYMDAERKECSLSSQASTFGELTVQNHGGLIEACVFKSGLGRTALLAASRPVLVKVLSELLPFSFQDFFLKLQDKFVEVAEDVATNSPWEFGFRDIIYKKFQLHGTEAYLKAFELTDYLRTLPQMPKDALYIYEVLKVDARKDGHMFINFQKLKRYYLFRNLGYQIHGEQRWQKALEYLEQNNVIVQEQFNGDVNIFLRVNWQAELDIVEGFKVIFQKHLADPLVWNINLESPDFIALRKDPDQLKASHLICNLPITVMSGKGGCGKTTVITRLIRHLCEQEEKRLADKSLEMSLNEEMRNSLNCENSLAGLLHEGNASQAELKQEDNARGSATVSSVSSTQLTNDTLKSNIPSTSKQDYSQSSQTQCLRENAENEIGETAAATSSQATSKSESKSARLRREVVNDLLKIVRAVKVEDSAEMVAFKESLLLVAPTGKAARLLGCKAGLPSATIHSILMSWRRYRSQEKNEEENKPWKYSSVQVLVVDECSLVSVRLFANLVLTLVKEAGLRKLVLLGDIRQLPSIEPGDFLRDIFYVFALRDASFSLSIELTMNHRSESTLIVKNASQIAEQIVPTFDPARRFHLVEISEQGDDNERDRLIRKLLDTCDDLSSHVDAQFVAFRNIHCQAINELCCRHYNQHCIKKGGQKARFDFQVGDKICLGKNQLVHNYINIILEEYETEFPELQKALSAAMKSVDIEGKDLNQGPRSEAQAVNNLTKSVLDATSALELFSGPDDVFDQTVTEMMEHDRKVEETKQEREKKERQLRAKQKSFEFKAKQEAMKHRKQKQQLLGKDEEKLCNGEVFFIMDEKTVIDKDGKPRHYLILSDQDPELPRVVCVPLRVLRKDCKMKHSWGRTIHTYQGSESSTVVYVLGPAMPQNWQHVYTAVTRGKKSVYVVGKWSQLKVAVERRPFPRLSHLRYRLKEMLMDQTEAVEACKEKFLSNYQTSCERERELDESDDSLILSLDESAIMTGLGEIKQSPKQPSNQNEAARNGVALHSNISSVVDTEQEDSLKVHVKSDDNSTAQSKDESGEQKYHKPRPFLHSSNTVFHAEGNNSNLCSKPETQHRQDSVLHSDVYSDAVPTVKEQEHKSPPKIRRIAVEMENVDTPFRNAFALSMSIDSTKKKDSSVEEGTELGRSKGKPSVRRKLLE